MGPMHRTNYILPCNTQYVVCAARAREKKYRFKVPGRLFSVFGSDNFATILVSMPGSDVGQAVRLGNFPFLLPQRLHQRERSLGFCLRARNGNGYL